MNMPLIVVRRKRITTSNCADRNGINLHRLCKQKQDHFTSDCADRKRILFFLPNLADKLAEIARTKRRPLYTRLYRQKQCHFTANCPKCDHCTLSCADRNKTFHNKLSETLSLYTVHTETRSLYTRLCIQKQQQDHYMHTTPTGSLFARLDGQKKITLNQTVQTKQQKDHFIILCRQKQDRFMTDCADRNKTTMTKLRRQIIWSLKTRLCRQSKITLQRLCRQNRISLRHTVQMERYHFTQHCADKEMITSRLTM